MNSIEIEVTGLMTEEKYHFLTKYLKENSNNNWEDSRETTFFVIPNTNLKVTKSISNGTAKISYKSTSSDNSSNLEIEFPIDIKAAPKAIEIFKQLGFTKFVDNNEPKINFNYKGSVISLKWNKEFGYHFEMMAIVEKDDQIPDAINKIDEICSEFGIKYLSESELNKMMKEIYRKNAGE